MLTARSARPVDRARSDDLIAVARADAPPVTIDGRTISAPYVTLPREPEVRRPISIRSSARRAGRTDQPRGRACDPQSWGIGDRLSRQRSSIQRSSR